MKKLLKYALILAFIGVLAYFLYDSSLGPCQKTLEYSVGRFDTQFGISEATFEMYITEAEGIWEKAIGKNVFAYKPNADFKINLIYDERQIATVQKQKTEFGLSAIENAFKKIDEQFTSFKNEYKKKVSLHEQVLALFNERKTAYDFAVAYWNSQRGAPRNEYLSLESERLSLNTEAERLNSQAASINTMAKQLSGLLEERNAKALQYNKIAEEYNKKYNSGLEFSQAEYVGNSRHRTGEINVYQFSNKKDLILALSHELGHALGMNHVDNSKSIMYYLTGINAGTNPVLSEEDLTELKRMCGI